MTLRNLIFMSKDTKRVYVQSCQFLSHLSKEQIFYKEAEQPPPPHPQTKYGTTKSPALEELRVLSTKPLNNFMKTVKDFIKIFKKSRRICSLFIAIRKQQNIQRPFYNFQPGKFQPLKKNVWCFSSVISSFIFDAKQKFSNIITNEIFGGKELFSSSL